MPRAVVILFILALGFFPFPSRAETPDYLGSETPRTPYDRKYRRVEAYLVSIQQIKTVSYNPSFSIQESKVRHYLKRARRFRFEKEDLLSSGIEGDYWQLPEETERVRSGDCEDLAIWLYYHLLDEGFRNIRFTLGFAGAEDKAVHAWVTWYDRGKTYILDPSRKEGIYNSTQLGAITYQPWYSYYFDRRWSHR
ncbi:MAG: hypothetical protein GTN74_00230 [Proteobacteria bacterium]|nr:hypothetical protein [Pseudomonadota bacterium]NIS67428.1 hypothetical protein [Pseudomonadota bacterium]